MAKKKLKKLPKPRNREFVGMLVHTKPGAHKDQKKEARRKECRTIAKNAGADASAFAILAWF